MSKLGCFCYLVNHTDKNITDCIKSLQLLKVNYLDKYPTPVLLFHEAALTEQMKQTLLQILPDLITFIPIEFTLPHHIVNICPSNVNGMTVRLGYMHMCRFFANAIFYHPALAEYEYYCRLDTDSFILSPVTENMFEQVKAFNIYYGFINDSLHDNVAFTRGLWPLAQKFITDNNIPVRRKLYSEIREGRVFYTNFEICYIPWFKQGIWPDFFKAIDLDGGIYRYRWGDHTIRYIGVNSFMPPENISRIHINYSHQGIGR